MKTLSLCALLCLLSILADGGISDALSGLGPGLPETPAAQSIPAAATSNGSNAVENFAEYVHLHKTRGEGISLDVAASAKACAE